MKNLLLAPALALAAITASAGQAQAQVFIYEEVVAHEEQALIYHEPIGGYENRYWFQYRRNISEADRALDRDLRRADDQRDVRDAWREYYRTLRKERRYYDDAMTERRSSFSLGVRIGN